MISPKKKGPGNPGPWKVHIFRLLQAEVVRWGYDSAVHSGRTGEFSENESHRFKTGGFFADNSGQSAIRLQLLRSTMVWGTMVLVVVRLGFSA